MARKPQPILAEVGTTGLVRYSGYVRDEFHKNLQGTQAIKVFTEMSLNDAVISGFLHAFEAIAKQAEWSVDPRRTPERMAPGWPTASTRCATTWS